MFQLINLGSDLLSFGQCNWEKTHLDQNVTQKFGHLLSDRFRSEEDIVLFSPFFDFCFVLIECLKTVDVDVGDVVGSCLFNVSSVSEDADLNDRNSTLMLE